MDLGCGEREVAAWPPGTLCHCLSQQEVCGCILITVSVRAEQGKLATWPGLSGLLKEYPSPTKLWKKKQNKTNPCAKALIRYHLGAVARDSVTLVKPFLPLQGVGGRLSFLICEMKGGWDTEVELRLLPALMCLESDMVSYE